MKGVKMVDKEKIIHSLFKNRVGVLATMHKKEQVISPILEKELGIKVNVPVSFNTDQFGTFTGDVERRGNQLEAAKYKAQEALKATGATLSIASEGSFGPHPLIPFIPFNREIVLLIDKENKLEIIGEAMTTETNYSHQMVKNFQQAYDFSIKAGFPYHGMVVKVNESTTDQTQMVKGITTEEDLKNAVEFILKKSKNNEVYIETDMRALYNPTRMKNIEAATKDLIKNIYNLCPKCSWPGLKLIERKKGLPCSWCGFPTELVLSLIYNCKKCGHSEEKFYPNEIEKADPGQCPYCNP